MLKVILFIIILLNFDLIAGDKSQQATTLNSLNAVISQKRILAAMECSRTGNKGRSCLLKVESDGVYEIKLDADTRLTATLALVNPNTNLNIAFTSDSNPPLTPKISIQKDQQKQDIRNNPSLTSIVIQKSIIEDYDGGIVRLEVFSPKAVKLTLKMSFDVEDDDSNDISLLVIILPIVGGMLIFLGLVCWCRFVNMRRQRMRRFIQRQPEQNGLLTEHREIEMEGNERLTEQNLNERFPEAKRDQIQSSFPQPACSVCLEEFQQDVPCRQLYCQHIFHSECIKLWFLNQLKKGHANCPNCNKSMLKKMELSSSQE